MNTKRYPIVFLVGGMMLKGLLVLLSGLIQSAALVSLLTTYDPLAFAFANWGSSLFFDPRRIAPGPGEAQIFGVLLVIGFGIECLLIGFVVRWFRQRRAPTMTVPLSIVIVAFGFFGFAWLGIRECNKEAVASLRTTAQGRPTADLAGAAWALETQWLSD